jgi:hypothetical protein
LLDVIADQAKTIEKLQGQLDGRGLLAV